MRSNLAHITYGSYVFCIGRTGLGEEESHIGKCSRGPKLDQLCCLIHACAGQLRLTQSLPSTGRIHLRLRSAHTPQFPACFAEVVGLAWWSCHPWEYWQRPGDTNVEEHDSLSSLGNKLQCWACSWLQPKFSSHLIRYSWVPGNSEYTEGSTYIVHALHTSHREQLLPPLNDLLAKSCGEVSAAGQILTWTIQEEVLHHLYVWDRFQETLPWHGFGLSLQLGSLSLRLGTLSLRLWWLCLRLWWLWLW